MDSFPIGLHDKQVQTNSFPHFQVVWDAFAVIHCTVMRRLFGEQKTLLDCKLRKEKKQSSRGPPSVTAVHQQEKGSSGGLLAIRRARCFLSARHQVGNNGQSLQAVCLLKKPDKATSLS